MSSGMHLYNSLPGPFLLFCRPYVLLPAKIRTPGRGGPHRVGDAVIVALLCLSTINSSFANNLHSMGLMSKLTLSKCTSYISQAL